jgi:hypothetical protein
VCVINIVSLVTRVTTSAEDHFHRYFSSFPHNKQPTAGGDFIFTFFFLLLLLKGHVKLKSKK